MVISSFMRVSIGERVTTLGEDLHEVVSEITTGKIETLNGVREGVTFVAGTVWETPSPESMTFPSWSQYCAQWGNEG